MVDNVSAVVEVVQVVAAVEATEAEDVVQHQVLVGGRGMGGSQGE